VRDAARNAAELSNLRKSGGESDIALLREDLDELRTELREGLDDLRKQISASMSRRRGIFG
jgi:hypothetical protein